MATDHLTHAQLIELDASLAKAKGESEGGKTLTVQFNLESLRLSHANPVRHNDASRRVGSPAAGAWAGDPAQGWQFIGSGSTRLAVQLWFDVTALAAGQERVDDVRRLTQQVMHFIRPQASPQDPTQFLPPGVRFAWGSFIFDGLVDSIEQTLDFFSPEGRPLRASIALSLSQPTQRLAPSSGGARLPGHARPPGTAPRVCATAGSSLQGLAAAAGAGADWQAIAQANGIDNPRQLAPGQWIDLQARPPHF